MAVTYNVFDVSFKFLPLDLMYTSFLSLRGDQDSGWNIVEKTFPEFSEGKFSDRGEFEFSRKLSVVSVDAGNGSFEDKRVAEAAAREMAEQKKVSFVPNDAHVITIHSFSENFLIFELTPNGEAFSQQKRFSDLESAKEEAGRLAGSKGAVFVAPEYV